MKAAGELGVGHGQLEAAAQKKIEFAVGSVGAGDFEGARCAACGLGGGDKLAKRVHAERVDLPVGQAKGLLGQDCSGHAVEGVGSALLGFGGLKACAFDGGEFLEKGLGGGSARFGAKAQRKVRRVGSGRRRCGRLERKQGDGADAGSVEGGDKA